MKPQQQLFQEYSDLFRTMAVNEANKPEVNFIVHKILKEKIQYENVENETGIPWFVVACIHCMEGSLNFSRQLHNGQHWNKKTTLVPKDLGPWNSWHEAACDAMNTLKAKLEKEFGPFDVLAIPMVCFAFENHNGWGYRLFHNHVKSPYLWGGSNHYKSGKYIEDGKWSDIAVSKQIGAMVIIKALLERTRHPSMPA